MKLQMDDPFGLDALFFNDAAASVGLQLDQFKFMLCIITALPLSWIHGAFIPKGTPRNLFSLALGMAYCMVCFAEDSLHPIGAAIYAYLLLRMFPRNPFYLLVVSFLHMSAAHLYAYIYEYGQWNIDYTMAHMVLVVKLQITAFAVSDGHDKNRHFNKKWGDDLVRDKITPDMMPSFLEWMAYCFYFPCFIAGPVFSYRNYREWVHGQVEIPSGRFAAAGWKLAATFILLILNKVVLGYFPSEAIIEPEGTGNPSIASYNVALRLGYIWVSIMLVRTKYFFVWYMCHASCILSGIAYNGKDTSRKSTIYDMMFAESVDSNGNKWDGCSNGNWVRVETSQNLKGVTDNWNMGVNYWLKNVFYIRVAESEHKLPKFLTNAVDVKTLVTQVTSAFWHGFYPGYYLFFMSGTLFHVVMRNSRRKIRPWFIHYGIQPVYNAVTFVATGIGCNYIGVPFIFYDFRAALQVWQSVYYIPHILCVVVLVVANMMPRMKEKNHEKHQ
eukprot:TRINITY_DN1309_c1_g1_i1.p1 TRINITY_DN1309_c1_g1~~TRINITY_DN1309_c1_g1_i1.p1  ORF type:complete len:536 (+),score=208.40 TRINITY_DN1309_c1_g1_i1:115-1608(+)